VVNIGTGFALTTSVQHAVTGADFISGFLERWGDRSPSLCTSAVCVTLLFS
jgi:hypothetical protein